MSTSSLLLLEEKKYLLCSKMILKVPFRGHNFITFLERSFLQISIEWIYSLTSLYLEECIKFLRKASCRVERNIDIQKQKLNFSKRAGG